MKLWLGSQGRRRKRKRERRLGGNFEIPESRTNAEGDLLKGGPPSRSLSRLFFLTMRQASRPNPLFSNSLSTEAERQAQAMNATGHRRPDHGLLGVLHLHPPDMGINHYLRMLCGGVYICTRASRGEYRQMFAYRRGHFSSNGVITAKSD